jgi:hypothetical protein
LRLNAQNCVPPSAIVRTLTALVGLVYVNVKLGSLDRIVPSTFAVPLDVGPTGHVPRVTWEDPVSP